MYTSADYGVTWIVQNGSGIKNWYSVASSADGSHLVAAANGDYMYTSADYGVTWIQRASSGSRNWYSVASSANGVYLAAVVKNGDIYTSQDSGVTWIDQVAAGSRNWSSIVSSADGSHLAADGGVYTSAGYGTDWTVQAATGSLNAQAIAMSADGSHLAIVVPGDYVYGGALPADTVAPVVTLTSPTQGATFTTGSAVSLVAHASDNVAVGGVTFYANGTQIGSEVFSNSATFTNTWTPSSAGTYTLTAVARDTANNTTPSAGAAVTVTGAVVSSGGGGGSSGGGGYYSSGQNTTTRPLAVTVPVTTNTSAPDATLSQYLAQGANSVQVQSLQKFLNSTGNTVAPSGVGAPGNESTYFGALTKTAVIKLQLKYDLPPTGYVGPLTLHLIQTLSTNTPVPVVTAQKPQVFVAPVVVPVPQPQVIKVQPQQVPVPIVVKTPVDVPQPVPVASMAPAPVVVAPATPMSQIDTLRQALAPNGKPVNDTIAAIIRSEIASLQAEADVGVIPPAQP